MRPVKKSDRGKACNRYGKRKVGTRKPALRILIVCEGKKTEPDYFRKFKRELRATSCTIEIAGKECNGIPLDIVEYAISKSQSQDDNSKPYYDEIWCVMDVEETSERHENMRQAIRKARQRTNRLELAISNPCFEYWLLLHYIKTSKSFTNKGIIEELEKQGGFGKYNKGNIPIDSLYPRVRTAIENAKAVIREQHYPDKASEDVLETNPVTYVQLLVSHLLK